ncbi:MAG: macro domain-containing protein [Oscillospiraceae bacterium]|nr:macro domain-containing protein [Oscillospiraceae bacterium]
MSENEKRWQDPYSEGCPMLENAFAMVWKYSEEVSDEPALNAIRRFIKEGGKVIFPATGFDETVPWDEQEFSSPVLELSNGTAWSPVFTNRQEYELGDPCETIAHTLDDIILDAALLEDVSGVVFNYYGDAPFLLSGEPEELAALLSEEPKSSFSFVKADAADMEVDAVVSEANRIDHKKWKYDVNFDLLRKGGAHIAKTFRAAEKLDNGESLVTHGGFLAAPWVIHTAVTPYDGSEECVRDLAACCWTVLETAKNNGFTSLAFPPLGSGTAGYPKKLAAQTIADMMLSWMVDNEDWPMDIWFCCPEDEDLELYKNPFEEDEE